MPPTTGSPIRDTNGHPIAYVDPARSQPLAGQRFAYRTDGDGWVYAGMFNSETDARRAVGLPTGCCR